MPVLFSISVPIYILPPQGIAHALRMSLNNVRYLAQPSRRDLDVLPAVPKSVFPLFVFREKMGAYLTKKSNFG
jgi:hypothetical protein